MTEVDAVYVNPKTNLKHSMNTDLINSTRHSEDQEGTSLPINRSSVQQNHPIESAEFQMVIKELIGKEQSDKLQIEQRILEKIRKRNLSKGWDRPSGAKMAPLKVLQSM